MSVTPEVLHGFPLFEEFNDEQLAWLVERGQEVTVPAGTKLFEEDEAVNWFYVLLEGEIELRKRIDNHERVTGRSDTPGVWAGALPVIDDRYQLTARVPRDSRLFRISGDVMRDMVASGFPVTRHLLLGARSGTARFLTQVQEHQKLTALGKMAAGLAHELNNPASAARRSAAELARVLDDLDASWMALSALPGQQWRGHLEQLTADLKARQPDQALTPMERSDREDEVGAWLEDHGLSEAWELAPALIDAGVDVAWLEDRATQVEADALAPLLRWAVSRATAYRLVAEVDHSAGRVSELVRAVKDYSYMDRGDVQDVDVRAGLQSTLTILRHRLGEIEVERHDDPDLPPICARGSELNQVWTNLIDNAIDAVAERAGDGGGERGRIRITTRADGDEVVVEVADNGPGIPPELQARVFEPFFTTKPVGQGTGVGLDTSYRIVVEDHGGSLTLNSEPGDTRFTVRLPVRPPEPE